MKIPILATLLVVSTLAANAQVDLLRSFPTVREFSAKHGSPNRDSYSNTGTTGEDLSWSLPEHRSADLWLYRSTGAQPIQKLWNFASNTGYGNATVMKASTLSRFPLGVSAAHSEPDQQQANHGVMVVRADPWIVSGKISYPFVRKQVTAEIRQRYLEDYAVLENLVRGVVNDLMVHEAEVVNLSAGLSALRRAGEPTLRDLQSWAEAKDIQVHVDTERHAAFFGVGHKAVLLPAASDQVQILGQWRPLGSFVLTRNGRWYVDIAKLELLLAE